MIGTSFRLWRNLGSSGRQQLTVLNRQVNSADRLTAVEQAVDYPGRSVKE